MGLPDQALGGVVGGASRKGTTGAAMLPPALMSMLLGRSGMVGAGGLGGLLNQLTQAGHGDVANS